jgi:hypothetical protein
LRFRQEAIEDCRDLVGLPFLGFPLRNHQQATTTDGFANRLTIPNVLVHGLCSLFLGSRW